MKRYDVYADDNGPSVEEERPNGVYVYYEDAARIIAQRDRLAKLLRKTMNMTKWYIINPDVKDHANDCLGALDELDKEKQS